MQDEYLNIAYPTMDKETLRMCQDQYGNIEFLAQSTAACQERRDSIASTQLSFSSTSSYFLEPAPPTPVTRYEDLSNDVSFVKITDPRLLADGSSPEVVGETTIDDYLQGPSLPIHTRQKDNPYQPQVAPGWPVSVEINGFTRFSQDRVMPASGDFSAALEAQLPTQNDESIFHEHLANSIPSSWDVVSYGPLNSAHQLPSTNVARTMAPSMDSTYQWTMVPFDNATIPSVEEQSPTVAPSETSYTLVDDEAYVEIAPESLQDSHMYREDYYSEVSESPLMDNACKTPEEPEIKEDPDPDYLGLNRSMSTSRTGGKTIVKKERRKGRVGKKSKGRPTKILKSFIGESEVAVDIDPNLWILPDGSWGPQDGPTAKQGCRFVGPNGPCGKMFKRAEHLKRHYKTHSGTKSFRCPICENCFGRNDNKNQHYKTHIKPTRTPRNDRWEHEIMFKKLRNDAKENNESLEEVEKVIQSLKNFIANGFV